MDPIGFTPTTVTLQGLETQVFQAHTDGAPLLLEPTATGIYVWCPQVSPDQPVALLDAFYSSQEYRDDLAENSPQENAKLTELGVIGSAETEPPFQIVIWQPGQEDPAAIIRFQRPSAAPILLFDGALRTQQCNSL